MDDHTTFKLLTYPVYLSKKESLSLSFRTETISSGGGILK
jgi:hypothetical protein